MRTVGSREFENLLKCDLYQLIEQMKGGSEEARLCCIEFFLAESRGIWHGRARAKIARNLKSMALDKADADRLVTCIIDRLLTGNFSEQFRDQLNLALCICPDRVGDAARDGAGNSKAYVSKYCQWTLKRRDRMQSPGAQ